MVVVAHRGESAFVAHQVFQHLVLRGVGVLVFVHQHVPHLRLPFGAHVWVVLQQFERQANQVVKVHRLKGAQSLFITRHHFGNDAFIVVFGLCQCHLGVQTLVFPRANGPLPLPCCGNINRAADIFQYAGDVVGVQN